MSYLDEGIAKFFDRITELLNSAVECSDSSRKFPKQFQAELTGGAIITLAANQSKVRILPI
jgi:hypothetical protein